jgi:hypothetical protein
MTYEGARSITGPYLGLLGVTGTTIGIVSGVGELVGYAVRLGSGYLADFSGRYWAVTICGYLLNLLAVPLLALAGNWQIAVVLIIAERMGRAIRSPPRDAMLSHAAGQTGLGWGFGLHQALDQTGAVVGPLIVSGVLFLGNDYRAAFAVLLAPALVSILLVFAARLMLPRPRDFELAPPALDTAGLAPTFRVYLVAVAFIAAGYADFALIAYHFDKAAVMPATWIPIVYAIAMAVGLDLAPGRPPRAAIRRSKRHRRRAPCLCGRRPRLAPPRSPRAHRAARRPAAAAARAVGRHREPGRAIGLACARARRACRGPGKATFRWRRDGRPSRLTPKCRRRVVAGLSRRAQAGLRRQPRKGDLPKGTIKTLRRSSA